MTVEAPALTVISIDADCQIWEAAAKSDDPPALKGVRFGPESQAWASDGFIAAMVECQVDGELTEPIIIPAEFVKAASKASVKPLGKTIIRVVGNRAENFDGSQSTPLITANFPDFRGIIPSQGDLLATCERSVSINPKLLGRLAKALGVGDTGYQRIYFSGGIGVVLPSQSFTNCLGLIMLMGAQVLDAEAVGNKINLFRKAD